MKRYSVSFPRTRLLAALLFLVAFILQAQAQGSLEKALVSVIVNGNAFGDAELSLSKDGSFLIPSSLVRHVLAGVAKPEIVMAFSDSDALVPIEGLSIFGIRVQFDAPSLALFIEVPPSDMSPVDLLAGKHSPAPSGTYVRQENFSALLGLSLKFVHDREGNPLASSPKSNASLDLEPAFNIFGFVAEASVETGWKDGFYAELSSARIVKDFQKSLTRLSGGYIDSRARTFQSSIPVYGIALNHEASLLGDAKPMAETLQEFVLEKTADVSIMLNGVTLKQVRLQPGIYRLTDLPLASGFNDVVIAIAEAGKEKRELHLAFSWDGALLPKGGIDWYAGFGLSRDASMLPFGTAYVSLGATRTLTVGLDAQAGFGTLLGGAQATWASPIGSLSTGAALSWSYEGFPLFTAPLKAFRFNWRFSLPLLDFSPQLSLGAEYREALFTAPRQDVLLVIPNDSDTVRLSMQLSQKLAGNGILVTVASADFEAWELSKSAFSLGFHQVLSKSISLAASVGLDVPRNSAAEPFASFSVSIAPSGRGLLHLREDLITKRDGADLSLPFGNSMGGGITAHGEGLVSSAIDGGLSPRSASLSVNAPFSAFELSLGAAYQNDPSFSTEQLSVNGTASTTLAYAGGYFGMARDVPDSFAFVVPDKSVGRDRVDIVSAGSVKLATSSERRVTILPNLPSYKNTAIGVEMPESPPDTSPAVPNVVLKPGYRSASVVSVSVRRSFLVRGTLLDADGKVSKGNIGDLSKYGGEALGIATFTDDAGVFELYGLMPGSYSIRWADGSSVSFSIGESESKEIDIGKLVCERQSIVGLQDKVTTLPERIKP